MKRIEQIVKGHCQDNSITDLFEKKRVGFEYLHKKCEESLAAFPTTYEFDLEQMKRDDLSQNVRNAILARSGEKSVTDFYRRFATEGLRLIKQFNDESTEVQNDPKALKNTKNKYARQLFTLAKTFTEQNLIVDSEIPFQGSD